MNKTLRQPIREMFAKAAVATTKQTNGENSSTNGFSFNMNFSKAGTTEGGKPYVDASISDTRLDAHSEHMTEKSLHDMAGFMKQGTVMLLPEHGSSFEIGIGVDGWVTKAADGHWELGGRFELDPDDKVAMKLHKEVTDGTCKRQLSVGGDAEVHRYYNDELKKTVRSLDTVVDLEHVACTRPNRAAVKSTGFVSAIFKSLGKNDDLDSAYAEFSKAALSDQERRDYATVVIDNNYTHSFYAEGGSLYLFPIPPGDRNAAKVALSEMYQFGWLTREQRQAVHDKAADVLGDEHNSDYCFYCDYRDLFEDSAPAGSLQKDKTGGPTTMTPDEEKKIKDQVASQGLTLSAIAKALGITPAEPGATTVPVISGAGGNTQVTKTIDTLQKEADEAAAALNRAKLQTPEGIQEAIGKGLELGFMKLADALSATKPQERTRSVAATGSTPVKKQFADIASAIRGVAATGKAAGTEQVQKNADGTTPEGGTALDVDDDELTEVEKAIAKNNTVIAELDEKMATILEKRKRQIEFSTTEQIDAERTVEKRQKLADANKYMAATNTVVE